MTLWRMRTVAVWGYSTTDAPVISDMRIADSSVGFFWGVPAVVCVCG